MEFQFHIVVTSQSMNKKCWAHMPNLIKTTLTGNKLVALLAVDILWL